MDRYLKSDPSLKSLRRSLRASQTETEKYLWSKIRNNQLGCRFFRQYSVGRYILDFYSPTLKLAIELDGSQHSEENNIEKDNTRTQFLESNGIKVIRFWDNEVFNNPEGVLTRIQD